MKNKNRLLAAVAFATLFSGVTIGQEDTVKVTKETKETTVIRDTVAKQAPAKATEPAEKIFLPMVELGVRYMPSFSSLNLRTYNGDIVQGDFTMSNGFGIMMAVNVSKNIGLQAELNYLEINQKYKDQNLNRQVNVSYLNIPVLLSINTNKTKMVNLNFVVGPQFGVNLGSNIQTTGNENTGTLHATVAAKGTDIGIAYGTGLEIALTPNHCLRLDFGYRGSYGLVDASANQSSSNPDTYNVYVRASRKTHAAYVGLTWCF